MSKQVAFLRAINVGGRRIKMDELNAIFKNAGLKDVQTFLASGNVIFDINIEDAPLLEEKLEQSIFEHFGFESHVMIRSIADLKAIQLYEAFRDDDIEQAVAYNVAFLKKEISGEAQKRLMALQNEVDRFHVHEREIYWLCVVKQSESKFSNVVLERTIKAPSTFRGISTINKLLNKFA